MSGRRWVLLLGLLLSTGGVEAARALLSARYFVETSHYLYEPALSYWTEYGGLPVFGFPMRDGKDSESTKSRGYHTGTSVITRHGDVLCSLQRSAIRFAETVVEIW